jgi:L-ascorbate metabolism protein UlaG (beta-lactamase superfamily)
VNVNPRHLRCLAAACVLLLMEMPALAEVARSNRQTDTIQTSAGPLRIMPVYHGSVMLEFGGKVIHIDPWSQGDFSGLPQADMLVFTHTHADHLDRAMIDKLKKPGTILLGSPAVIDTINCSCPEAETISNGEKKTFMGIEIEAVPMYNIVQGAAPGKPFHHKGIGNGYILNFGDTRVYISGDTECIPEMKSLKNITVAFISMNPPRTSSPAEAAECVKEFRPKIVYPYHYRGQKTQDFADALKNTPGVEVRLRKLEGEPQ